jgi:hypothetical protein
VNTPRHRRRAGTYATSTYKVSSKPWIKLPHTTLLGLALVRLPPVQMSIFLLYLAETVGRNRTHAKVSASWLARNIGSDERATRIARMKLEAAGVIRLAPDDHPDVIPSYAVVLDPREWNLEPQVLEQYRALTTHLDLSPLGAEPAIDRAAVSDDAWTVTSHLVWHLVDRLHVPAPTTDSPEYDRWAVRMQTILDRGITAVQVIAAIKWLPHSQFFCGRVTGPNADQALAGNIDAILAAMVSGRPQSGQIRARA